MTRPASGDQATTDRLSERAHESVSRSARTADRGEGEERIRDGAADAEARVREAGRKAKERTDETLHTITGFVRENPWTSLGLAFAAGTLVVALTRRS